MPASLRASATCVRPAKPANTHQARLLSHLLNHPTHRWPSTLEATTPTAAPRAQATSQQQHRNAGRPAEEPQCPTAEHTVQPTSQHLQAAAFAVQAHRGAASPPCVSAPHVFAPVPPRIGPPLPESRLRRSARPTARQCRRTRATACLRKPLRSRRTSHHRRSHAVGELASAPVIAPREPEGDARGEDGERGGDGAAGSERRGEEGLGVAAGVSPRESQERLVGR